MVRKMIATFAIILLLLCVAATTVSATSVYEGTISSTYTSIAEQINISVVDDYVFFRSDQHTYTLISGDIVYSDGNFNLNDGGMVYTITQVTGSGYSNSYYAYTAESVTTYSVETNGILVYSNLGGYPSLDNNGDLYSFITMFLILIIGLCAFIRPIFNFVMRNRSDQK